ncbi:hypothetical protein KAW18_03595 [candidate division WOR-3 bacterium]|nr:hypothetical protein [candidate division WOR-3 bacterium]
MTGKGSGKRGRPLGFRLSDDSKRSISQSKLGQKHKEITKDKISRSLLMYFRRKNPLSEELIDRYYNIEDVVLCDWICKIQDTLDASMDILTERSMKNKTRIEIVCGHNIESFGHSITPELLVLFKEFCEENNLDVDEVFDSLN